MVGILGSSSTISITSYGYSCQNHCSSYVPYCAYLSSDIKSNRWCARSYGLNMLSMSKLGNTLFGFSKLDFPQKGLVLGSIESNNSSIGPQKVASVEFGSVCDEEDKVIRKEMENVDVNQLEQKLPTWGNSSLQRDLDFVPSGTNQSSIVSKRTVTGDESRVYFLEERNEEVLSERVLRLSRSNKIRSAMELYRSMEYSGLQPSLHACNSLISCLLRKGLLDDALRIFESMRTSENITGHTYSLVIKGIANVRDCDAALNMFEEFERKGNVGKNFDAVVYNTMISVCGKVNNWVPTVRIWRSMKDNGLTGTAVTYRLLVCIFVRCGQNELAIDAYHEMLQNGLSPDEDMMQAIIGACSKEGEWDLARSVFESMLSRGMKPSLVTCNALINALGKVGKVKLAFGTYSSMKSLGHAPDSYTWNALLGALYRANRHADALRLFESIKKEQSCQLTLHLYNTCLMSCQRLGFWDKALQLLWQMEEASGLPVPTASYNLVIGACEVARKPKIALQVYERMVHQKCVPDTFTLLSLIRSCVWGSLWHEVEEILNQVSPDASLYNAAIQGMCLRGQIDLAKKLYTKMRESNLKPDGKTRALILQSLPRKSIRLKKRYHHG
ncbi:pentatricopeptide repeat-containing protein At3g29290-like isoform X1 [Actinidia eriantha]|uniref:pentatricopeptide repeat-containing protein At3g29290-like isoform X1 n=1 Tax=Actinidia eriantha TaxID=165200 RepID=UPI002585F055|nr:pentatricopeptide repeat-containing protein At3g29290-like isoform X1 [Actinidia eriantha]